MASTTALVDKSKVWAWAIIMALVGGFLFIRPYFSTILLAILVAFLVFPVHKKFLKKFPKRKSMATAFSTVFMFIVIMIPICVILSIAVVQGSALVNSVDVSELTNSSGDINKTVVSTIDQVNGTIKSITGSENVINVQNIQSFIENAIPTAINVVIDGIIGIVSGIPTFFVHLIMFIFVFVGILSNYKKLLDTIHYLSPFDKKVTKVYLEKIGAMATAMTRGQLIIASLQGLASALGLMVLGLGDYFFILFLLFTFLSFIPLGAGIITIPIGFIAILLGQVWQGVVILLNHFLIVSSIDNFRPMLVPKEARLPAALTLIGAFSGVAIFGFLGVIYGPVIMIVITTTIATYVEIRKSAEKGANKKAKA